MSDLRLLPLVAGKMPATFHVAAEREGRLAKGTVLRAAAAIQAALLWTPEGWFYVPWKSRSGGSVEATEPPTLPPRPATGRG